MRSTEGCCVTVGHQQSSYTKRRKFRVLIMQKTEAVSSTRFRKIRGGLDSAVKQADDRRLQELFIVDCDAHQQEFYSSFVKRVDKKFRGRIKLVDVENDPMVSKQREVQRGSSLSGFGVR